MVDKILKGARVRVITKEFGLDQYNLVGEVVGDCAYNRDWQEVVFNRSDNPDMWWMDGYSNTYKPHHLKLEDGPW